MSQPTDPLALLWRVLTSPASDADPLQEHEEEASELLEAMVATLPPVQPSTSARHRLLRAARLSKFTGPLATLFDIGLTQAADYLRALTDGSLGSAFIPGASLRHFAGGASTAGADVGFVEVAPDLAFPAHTHHGEERNLVLEGSLIEPDGTIYRAGDTFSHGAGTHHVFRSGPDGLVFAVVVWGVDFGDSLSVH